MEKKNYVYLLRCADDTLYCGWTNDLDKRIKVHQSGKGAKYTRSRLPVSLAYYEEFETATEAQKREYEIKQMTRQQKIKLIEK
jgi:putative endonuclease